MRWPMVSFFCIFKGNILCWCARRKGLLQLSVSHTDFSSILQGQWVFLMLGAGEHLLTNIQGGDALQWPDKNLTRPQSMCYIYFHVSFFLTFTGPWWNDQIQGIKNTAVLLCVHHWSTFWGWSLSLADIRRRQGPIRTSHRFFTGLT